jgi:hypothetical protein
MDQMIPEDLGYRRYQKIKPEDAGRLECKRYQKMEQKIPEDKSLSCKSCFSILRSCFFF